MHFGFVTDIEDSIVFASVNEIERDIMKAAVQEELKKVFPKDKFEISDEDNKIIVCMGDKARLVLEPVDVPEVPLPETPKSLLLKSFVENLTRERSRTRGRASPFSRHGPHTSTTSPWRSSGLASA